MYPYYMYKIRIVTTFFVAEPNEICRRRKESLWKLNIAYMTFVDIPIFQNSLIRPQGLSRYYVYYIYTLSQKYKICPITEEFQDIPSHKEAIR